MKPEQQRIAIAEACGWTHIEKEGYTQGYPGGIFGYRPVKPMFDSCRTFEIPNYLNDLNAMHEAEKMMSELDYDDYSEELYKHYAVSATAAQRAEAFLKTLNLWKE